MTEQPVVQDPDAANEEWRGLDEDAVEAARILVAGIRLSEGRPAKRPLEEAVSPEHTAQLIDTVVNHGMNVDRNGVRMINHEFPAQYGLDTADMDAIGAYCGGYAKIYNDYLRGRSRGVIDRARFERFRGLFAEDDKLPVTQGGEVVYRGMPDIGNGESWHEPAFSSVTVLQEVAEGFVRSAQARDGSGKLCRMVLPAGIRYLPVGRGEAEIILETDLSFDPSAFSQHPAADSTTPIDVLVTKPQA